MKLKREFYLRDNVVQIAKELLGKILFTNINGKISGGIITETEAYAGVSDKASHAFGGRKTKRTEVMYGNGGTAYVYLCYGIHHLFNVITNQKGIPHAILIRAVKPCEGINIILKRRNQKLQYRENNTLLNKICTGPGTISQGLGITVAQTGTDLLGTKIWIEDRGIVVLKRDIITNTRIGIDYAGADALLPYRFFMKI